MNPLFQAVLNAAVVRKVTCPRCRREQVVTARKKRAGTRCKFCGSNIPPSDK